MRLPLGLKTVSIETLTPLAGRVVIQSKLAASIKVYEPLTVDRSGNIIDGMARYMALKSIGTKFVEVNVVLSDADWDAFGYPTNDPCIICERRHDNRMEPRFGYVVCREHAATPPIDIPQRPAFNGERS